MKPYVAQLVFSIKCDGITTGEYEEQLRLIYAANDAESIEASKVMAAEEDIVFSDTQGRKIRWEFVAIKDIQPLQQEHGHLINSSIYENIALVSPLWEKHISKV